MYRLKAVRLDDGSFKITIDQDSYIETLVDVDISPDRLRQDGSLSKSWHLSRVYLKSVPDATCS